MPKIRELAKEGLTREEIKNKMLLNTHREGRNAWQIATYRGELDLVQEIYEWAKDSVTTEDIKNEMLLRTDGGGRNS